MANAGVSDEIRRKLTGHKSPIENARYTHLQIGILKDAVKAIPMFGTKAEGEA